MMPELTIQRPDRPKWQKGDVIEINVLGFHGKFRITDMENFEENGVPKIRLTLKESI